VDPIFVRDILLEWWIKPVPSNVAEVMAILNSLGIIPSFETCTVANYSTLLRETQKRPS